jgi:hypothetical protein
MNLVDDTEMDLGTVGINADTAAEDVLPNSED